MREKEYFYIVCKNDCDGIGFGRSSLIGLVEELNGGVCISVNTHTHKFLFFVFAFSLLCKYLISNVLTITQITDLTEIAINRILLKYLIEM